MDPNECDCQENYCHESLVKKKLHPFIDVCIVKCANFFFYSAVEIYLLLEPENSIECHQK